VTELPIENQHLLTENFGHWPSFHDAEILSIVLDRDGDDSPSLTTKMHLWATTDEVDKDGQCAVTNHTIAAIRFRNIQLDSLTGFNQQNVLFGLEITEVEPIADGNYGRRFDVAFLSTYGCSAQFRCASIVVQSADACG
jgi:hypothetical protein